METYLNQLKPVTIAYIQNTMRFVLKLFKLDTVLLNKYNFFYIVKFSQQWQKM